MDFSIEFSKQHLLMVLKTCVDLIEEEQMSEELQKDLFERLVPSKPDNETIQCLLLGLIFKHYIELSKTSNTY